MKSAIQYMESFRTAVEAIQVSAFLRGQDGFIGGRIITSIEHNDDARSKIRHRAAYDVQIFFDDPAKMKNGAWNSYGDWLPSGCRRVMMPESILRRIA